MSDKVPHGTPVVPMTSPAGTRTRYVAAQEAEDLAARGWYRPAGSPGFTDDEHADAAPATGQREAVRDEYTDGW